MADDRIAILTDDEEELKKRHLERFDRLSLEIQSDQPSQPSENNAPNDMEPTPSPQHNMGCCERLFLRVNRRLLVSKVFYLFFYAAYGSLHPLLALFYKQLGMNPTQSGLLVGVRYFIEFCSAPFWGIVADRYRKGKAVLLFSMLCWLLFNSGIAFVQPPDMKCKENLSTTTAMVTTVNPTTSNETLYPNTSSILTTNQTRQRRDLYGHYPWRTIPLSVQSSGYSSEHRFKRDSNRSFTVASDEQANKTESDQTTTTRPEPSTSFSTSTPNNTNTTSSSTTQSTTLKPSLPPPEYNMDQVNFIFLLILLIIIVGEFFSAPAITIVDTVTLQYLGPHRDRYGLQRMWGSLGWGIAMLCVGIWIDHTSTNLVIGKMECVMENYKDYRIAFILFGVLMGVALIIATQFKFNVSHQGNSEENEVGNQHAQPRGSPGMANSEIPTIVQAEEFHFWDLMRLLCGVQYGTVLFVAWFMGFGYGFVFTFLYWHLQDLTGTTTLFGVCSVLSHVSELAAYFTSHKFIELVGHIRVLYIGLACNTARYLYISYLENAWTVLPMEVLQGITHASVWASCISYLSAAVPPALRTSAQGILQGLHLGLGRGCGAMVGGIFVNYFGAAETFRGIGMTSLVILLLFSLIMCITGQNEKKEDKMLAENIPIPFSPVPIATIHLVQNTPDVVAPTRPEPKLPARKTKHQEDQEDLNKPAWVPSGSPWVSVVLLFYQIKEMVIMAKTHHPIDVQPLQDTDEVLSDSREDDLSSPAVFSNALQQENFPSTLQSQEDPWPPGATAQLEFPPQSVLQP
ncbi:major facilitator superfamily domain-containing protein 6-A [Siphateles boraxobius]|uniref:major facilitator superfamily domain-containing protein 6-A n=1 Tax=Siphateles boraxobius TaxID=180520 RepID=UPI004063EB35